LQRSRCALDHEKLDGSLMPRTIFSLMCSLAAADDDSFSRRRRRRCLWLGKIKL
jgi:hypothetical protein